MSTQKLILTSSGLSNVILESTYDDEFLFILPNQKIQIPRIFAEFISPKISKIHQSDLTIDSINFVHELEGIKITEEIISKIKFLSMGKMIEISEEESFLLQIFSILFDNEELFTSINQLFHDEISENKIDQYLKNLQFFDKISINPQFFDYSSMINFISSHFYSIDQKKLLQLPTRILYSIISNEFLQIETEDSLFDFIIQFFNDKKENQEKVSNNESKIDLISFYEQINFENLSEQKIEQFLDTFDPNEMSTALWNKLRPCIHESPNRKKNQRETKKHEQNNERIKTIKYDGNISNSLNGIIDYLTKESGGNVSDNGTVKATTITDRISLEARNAVDLHNDNNGFISTDVSNMWLKYDFVDRKVCPTSYTIKSRHNYNDHHPRSWVIEGSNTDSESDWTILDERNNYNGIEGMNVCYAFEMKEQTEFYRYLRIRQTGKNSSNYDYLCLSGLEYFGRLLEVK
ncbi:hypothetical protein M9Y10_019352 [Tritrichomonas musculus]|uniref:BACK domain-containing protein n=1 Tax=Tritrichomonas musculus TaxID=1915356 RepID=A0ABR2HJ75_9EUKA